MPKTQEFKENVYRLVKDEYTVLGKYVDSRTKIKIKHNACGHEYMVDRYKFISTGRRCPKCRGGVSFTHEQYVDKLYELAGDEYTAIERYENSLTKIKVKHNICGHVYEVAPSKFINVGRRCPNCRGGVNYTHEEYSSRVHEVVGNEYSVLTQYKNQKKRIKLKHNKCGHEWMVNPSAILNGKRCPKCQHRSYVKTQEEFLEEVFELVGEEFEVLGKYKNNNTKILIKHNECGFEYEVTPYHFTHSGSRCPRCKESRMERVVTDLLVANNILFVSEKRFEDCRNKRPLPFDFYIPCLNTIIETDGIQHFEPKWGEETFKQTVINDNIKNLYCIEKKIRLIRIPYYDINNIKPILIKNKIIPSEA